MLQWHLETRWEKLPRCYLRWLHTGFKYIGFCLLALPQLRQLLIYAEKPGVAATETLEATPRHDTCLKVWWEREPFFLTNDEAKRAKQQYRLLSLKRPHLRPQSRQSMPSRAEGATNWPKDQKKHLARLFPWSTWHTLPIKIFSSKCCDDTCAGIPQAWNFIVHGSRTKLLAWNVLKCSKISLRRFLQALSSMSTSALDDAWHPIEFQSNNSKRGPTRSHCRSREEPRLFELVGLFLLLPGLRNHWGLKVEIPQWHWIVDYFYERYTGSSRNGAYPKMVIRTGIGNLNDTPWYTFSSGKPILLPSKNSGLGESVLLLLQLLGFCRGGKHLRDDSSSNSLTAWSSWSTNSWDYIVD